MDIKEMIASAIELIQTVGFPISIACYLLYIHDKTLKDIANNINKLSNELSEICGYLKGLKND